VAVVLMLASPRGRANGPAFVAGWIVGLAVVGAIVLLLAGAAGASDGGAPKTWVGVVKLVLGLLLLVFAVVQWRKRPGPGEAPPLPSWMSKVDSFTPPKAAGLAALLAGVNPKNLGLTVAAATSIAGAGITGGDEAVTLAVFVLVATIGPAIPLGIYFGMGDRATKVLGDLRTWMVRENVVIMAVLLLVIGAKLIGDAVSGLSA
jgi:hypothetical protein